MKTTFFSILKANLADDESCVDEGELISVYQLLVPEIAKLRAAECDSLSTDDDDDQEAETEIGSASSPTTPKTPTEDPTLAVVKMKMLNVDELRESIIYTLYCQRAALRRATLKLIVQFLDGDFVDLTRQIELQVFVHYCKVDLEMLCDDYKYYRRFDVAPELTRDQCYDEELRRYASLALEPLQYNSLVARCPDEDTAILKELLRRPAFLSVFQTSLNEVLTTSNYDDSSSTEKTREWITKQIDEMVIYNVISLNAWPSLRGAALVDGILLCSGNLVGAPKSNRYNADMLCLLCHESVHYLARLKFNDFNFSSPWKYLPDGVEKRLDMVNETMPLEESGRNVESLLCGGIKPNWAGSLDKAAKLFLDRMTSKETYPIIERGEHKEIGLAPFQGVTRYFGVDVKPENFDYY